jgi:hypothetical protein
MNKMTSKKRTSKQAARNESLSSISGTLKQGFDKLLEFQQAQEIRFRPEVPDVPRIRFARDRIMNIELSYFNNITTSATVATTGGFSFQLANFANAANYLAVYDQYRILQANIKFVPIQTTMTAGSPGVGGMLYTVIDYDDANSPTNLTTLLSYDTLAITPPGIIEERTLYPRLATAAYAGAFTSFANMSSKTWIDSASPNVQYYGIKYYVPPTPTVQTFTYVITVMVQFRAERSP